MSDVIYLAKEIPKLKISDIANMRRLPLSEHDNIRQILTILRTSKNDRIKIVNNFLKPIIKTYSENLKNVEYLRRHILVQLSNSEKWSVTRRILANTSPHEFGFRQDYEHVEVPSKEDSVLLYRDRCDLPTWKLFELACVAQATLERSWYTTTNRSSIENILLYNG